MASEPQPKMWQNLTLKAWSIRNALHQGRWWMENSILMFWGNWGQKIWHKHPDQWHYNSWALHRDNTPAHTSLTVRQFLASTKMPVIPHPPYLQDPATCDFFLFPKMKLKLKMRCYDSTKQIQIKSQTDAKWLPEVLPIMEILLELLYHCRRGLLRREWGRTEISVSG